MLLEEFDSSQKAIINPWDLQEKIPDFPKTVVTCFARTTFDRMVHDFQGQVIAETSMANVHIPIYQVELAGQKIAIYNSPVGASACVAVAEELFAMGAQRFLVFGTCGILDQEIEESSIIVPLAALRDEGTSFHYLAPSDKVLLDEQNQASLIAFLNRNKISYQSGTVWTTDGIYRETLTKMRQRQAAGAICVDMECSAMVAWASFRKLDLAYFFYAADHLSEEKWQPRTLSNDADLDTKDKIASLALEFVLSWTAGKE